jgi:hypothetical protein
MYLQKLRAQINKKTKERRNHNARENYTNQKPQKNLRSRLKQIVCAYDMV